MSTSIEWTQGDDGAKGETWNPTLGCSDASEGCRNCYAKRDAYRKAFNPNEKIQAAYVGLTKKSERGRIQWTGKLRLMPDRLGAPLRWRKPRRVFVNSMSDLFHEGVSDEQIAAVFGVMAACPQHTFQVLTKRPERARAWFRWVERQTDRGPMHARLHPIGVLLHHAQAFCAHSGVRFVDRILAHPWTLPNVWLGVSVEDQATADERIPILLDTPAAVRWVSYEPALAPVDFAKWLDPWTCSGCEFHGSRDDSGPVRCGDCDEDAVYAPKIGSDRCPKCGKDDGTSDAVGETCPQCGSVESWSRDAGFKFANDGGLDWIVIGGESGPGARPFDLAWARSTIRQAREADVPCFVKQLGAGLALHTDRGRGLHVRDSDRDTYALIRDRKGGDPSEWPEDLRVREFPRVASTATAQPAEVHP